MTSSPSTILDKKKSPPKDEALTSGPILLIVLVDLRGEAWAPLGREALECALGSLALFSNIFLAASPRNHLLFRVFGNSERYSFVPLLQAHTVSLCRGTPLHMLTPIFCDGTLSIVASMFIILPYLVWEAWLLSPWSAQRRPVRLFPRKCPHPHLRLSFLGPFLMPSAMQTDGFPARKCYRTPL